MPIPVSIPTQIRPLTNNLDTVELDGATLGDLLADLEKRYPGVNDRLHNEAGELRRNIAIYINGEDIRFLQDKDTAVKLGDEVVIVPSAAGG